MLNLSFRITLKHRKAGKIFTKIYRLCKVTDVSGIKHANTKDYETVEVHMSQLFDVVNRCERLLSSFGRIINNKIFPVTLSNIFPLW